MYKKREINGATIYSIPLFYLLEYAKEDKVPYG